MKEIILFFICLLSINSSFSQSSSSKIIEPIVLNKSTLSGVGLQKINIEDEPDKDAYQKNLYRGSDLSVYVVSSESWTNKNDNYPFDEFVYMYHGQAKVKPKKGPKKVFNSGEYFFAPKGFTGTWKIIAGENLHYEISVIATQRSDQALNVKKNHHQLYDKELISGVDIKLNSKGKYDKLLQAGAELTIHLKAEAPREKDLSKPSKEFFIHILSGQLTLTDKNEKTYIFHTGDFLVIPKGFVGKWESDGHGMLKYLSIERS